MISEKLRQLTPEELADRIGELRNQLFNLRVKHSTGQLENVGGMRTIRRDLARALGVHAERRQA